MTFEDVLEIKNGKNQRAVEDPNGIYPIYGSGGIMGYANDYICQADTVIIGRKGNINKPIYVNEPFWNVDTAFGLEAKKEVLLPKYLYYFCLRFDFERLNKAVTIPSLTKADLLKIELDLPDIAIQADVIDRLGRLERIIELRKKELLRLEVLTQARFVELFGDPENNTKGYKKEPLQKHADVLVGYPFKSEGYTERGVGIVGGYNLMQGFIIWEDCKHWPDTEGFEQYLLKDGDIVIAMDRPWVNGGFKIASVDKNHLPALLIQRTACVRGIDVEQEFLYTLLNSNWFADHCNITGSLVPHISNKDINSYEIILPSIEEQKVYADFFRQINKSKYGVNHHWRTHAVDPIQILQWLKLQEC